MRRALKIAAGLPRPAASSCSRVNAYILGQETKSAEVNAPDGQLTSDLPEDVALDLQYTDSPATGSGPEGAPIVLLHCYTCSLRWWDPIVPLLNEEHRVITFDLLGHGGSEKPKSGYEIENQAAAIADALNQLGVIDATVVGHSMGGVVATSLQEQASDLVGQVVLIDAPAESGDGDLPTTADLGTWPIVGEAMWRVKLDSMVKSAAESSFAPGTDVSEVFPDDPDRVVDDLDAMTFNSFEDSRNAVRRLPRPRWSPLPAARRRRDGDGDHGQRGSDPRRGRHAREVRGDPRRPCRPDRRGRATPRTSRIPRRSPRRSSRSSATHRRRRRPSRRAPGCG